MEPAQTCQLCLLYPRQLPIAYLFWNRIAGHWLGKDRSCRHRSCRHHHRHLHLLALSCAAPVQHLRIHRQLRGQVGYNSCPFSPKTRTSSAQAAGQADEERSEVEPSRQLRGRAGSANFHTWDDQRARSLAMHAQLLLKALTTVPEAMTRRYSKRLAETERTENP